MKTLLGAIGTCVLCVATGAAFGGEWTGLGTDESWSDDFNWANDTAPDTHEDVTIADHSVRATCVYDALAAATTFGALVLGDSMTFNVDTDTSPDLNFTSIALSGSAAVTGDSPWNAGSLNIDADAQSAALTLTKQGTNTLDVNGTLTLKGDADADHDATFTLSAGSITPDGLVARGSSSSSYAVLDLDQDFAVQGIAGTDTTMSGWVALDVAANKSASFKDTLYDASGTLTVTVGAGGACQTDAFKIQDAGADAAIVVTKAGAGTLSVSQLVIVGSTSTAASSIVSGGALVTR